MNAVESRRDYWLFFAGEARRGGSPVYARICEGIAEDLELQALAAEARPGQPPANILLAAVHFLLLGGVADRLRAFYPHLRAPETPAPDGDPFPAFRAFCTQHRAALVSLIRVRVTNTNEVRRSAVLYPAFTRIARQTRQSLHLIEIGPSAGLNLLFDRYAYRYQAPGSAETQCGLLTSPLTLACEARGPVRPPLDPHPPAVASRVGIELNPVDLTAESDRRWLEALLWPGPSERFARLAAALAIAACEPPPILAGDAVALLPEVLAALPGTGVPVVFHTHVTYQFPPAARAALAAVLAAASRAQPLHLVSCEWEGASYPLRHAVLRDGVETAQILAETDPHGAWLSWRAGPDGAA